MKKYPYYLYVYNCCGLQYGQPFRQIDTIPINAVDFVQRHLFTARILQRAEAVELLAKTIPLLSDLFVHDARQRRFVTAIASTFLNTSSKDFLVAEAAHIMTIFQFVLTHGVEFGLCALVDRLNDEVGDNISRINPRHHSQGSSGPFAGGFHQLTGRFSRLASCRFTHDFRQSFFQVLRDHRLNFVFNLTGHAIGEFRDQLILKA